MAEENKREKAYGDISAIPTQDAVEGIRFDFNSGLRVMFPEQEKGKEKNYHLQFSDADSGLILYEEDVKSGTVITANKKYYIRYNFVITDNDNGRIVFEHTLDLKDREVIVQFPVKTIGDSIGWFSYAERFQKKHRCILKLAVSPFMKELFSKQYPEIEFIEKSDTVNINSYASYYIGLFFNENGKNYQPVDFRQTGLHRTAAMILGLRTKEELEDIPPRLDLSAERKISEKYAVIATKASAQAKYWNNPCGWHDVICFLKENGYRVICIDKNRYERRGMVCNQIPWGVEDFTGDISLQERVNIIKDADLFIGLPSGLSWLAWCCKIPVVMISGFSLPNTEFYTPYRVINYNVCHGCWDDMRETFNHEDYFWCPRKKDSSDSEKFECTRFITSNQVISTIKKIPGFLK